MITEKKIFHFPREFLEISLGFELEMRNGIVKNVLSSRNYQE